MSGCLRPRSGAGLLLALVVLVVLECVVLGSMHLALLERQVADNAHTLLRLRIGAESAARTVLAHWTPDLDTMSMGVVPFTISIDTADGVIRALAAERLTEHLFLIRGEARQPPPLPGRGAALLLLVPPPLPPAVSVAGAALHAGGAVRLLEGGAVVVPELRSACDGPDVVALQVADLTRVEGRHDAVQGGTSLLSPQSDAAAHLQRLRSLAAAGSRPGLRLVDGDTVVSTDFTGVLLVGGNLLLTAARFEGLAIVGGDLTLSEGASISGAVHVAGSAAVQGRLELDGCAAARATADARLRVPMPGRGRAWLPAF
jgi:hypothetical protein